MYIYIYIIRRIIIQIVVIRSIVMSGRLGGPQFRGQRLFEASAGVARGVHDCHYCYVYIYIYIYIYNNDNNNNTCIYIYIYVYITISIYIYLSLSIYIYISLYIYIYIYIHAYRRAHLRFSFFGEVAAPQMLSCSMGR